MKIAIIGAGWLGLPLAKALQAQAYTVITTSTQLEKVQRLNREGVPCVQLILEADKIIGEIEALRGVDLYFINLPPGRKTPNVAQAYPDKIQRMVNQLQIPSQVPIFFASSTSVYGNQSGVITEESPTEAATESAQSLVSTEQWLLQQAFPTTILRLSGLVGGKRHPGRFLAGRKNLSHGDAPINLIHRADIITIVLQLIQAQKWPSIYNLCADQHPKKAEYYTYAASRLGLPLPHFLSGGANTKCISNVKIKRDLGYSFQYADPFDMLEQ